MDKKYIRIGAAIGGTLVLGLMFLGLGGGSSNSDLTAQVNKVQKPLPPTIQVVKAPVYLMENGAQVRELKDGETLKPPVTIKTGANGRANIVFADGSVARVDQKTEFTLKEGSYNPENKRLVNRIFLSVGRVWSKIVQLATPDSAWEVETSHAVATVRGTTFGISTDGKISKVLGSEHTVSVTPIDKKTGARAEAKSITVAENTIVEMSDAVISDVLLGKRKLVTAKASASVLADPWVRENRASDGVDRNGVKTEIKTEVKIETKPNTQTPTPKPVTVTPPPAAPKSDAKVTAIEIVTKSPLGEVKEGEKVQFTAFAKLSDGLKKEITSEATWQVLGPIGMITASGVFTSALDAKVAEYGEGSGAIVTTWTDPATKTPFIDKTIIFKVKAQGEPELNGEG